MAAQSIATVPPFVNAAADALDARSTIFGGQQPLVVDGLWGDMTGRAWKGLMALVETYSVSPLSLSTKQQMYFRSVFGTRIQPNVAAIFLTNKEEVSEQAYRYIEPIVKQGTGF